MEQLSMLEEEKEDKMMKQMKLAIKKGIVPSAKVILDGDSKYVYTIVDLYCSCDHNLNATLRHNNSSMSWNVLSERLSVFVDKIVQ